MRRNSSVLFTLAGFLLVSASCSTSQSTEESIASAAIAGKKGKLLSYANKDGGRYRQDTLCTAILWQKNSLAAIGQLLQQGADPNGRCTPYSASWRWQRGQESRSAEDEGALPAWIAVRTAVTAYVYGGEDRRFGVDALKLLIDAGARLNWTIEWNKRRVTALDYASIYGHSSLADLLRSSGTRSTLSASEITSIRKTDFRTPPAESRSESARWKEERDVADSERRNQRDMMIVQSLQQTLGTNSGGARTLQPAPIYSTSTTSATGRSGAEASTPTAKRNIFAWRWTPKQAAVPLNGYTQFNLVDSSGQKVGYANIYWDGYTSEGGSERAYFAAGFGNMTNDCKIYFNGSFSLPESPDSAFKLISLGAGPLVEPGQYWKGSATSSTPSSTEGRQQVLFRPEADPECR